MLTSPSWTRILQPCPIHAQRPMLQRRLAADLERHAGADEAQAVGLQPSAEAELQPRPAREQRRVVGLNMRLARMKRSSASGPPRSGAGARLTASRAAARGSVGCGGVGEQSPWHRIVWRGTRLAPGRPCDDARSMTEATLAQRLLDGDRRALARAITLVEDDRPEGWELVREVYPHTGKAEVVGFTGPPGVGKSTLIGALTRRGASAGRTVGVLSIDPSSPFTQRRAARRQDPARPSTSSTAACSSARWPTGARSAGSPRRRCRRRCCSTRPDARTCSWRPSASGRRRSTSSITPTRSCSC